MLKAIVLLFVMVLLGAAALASIAMLSVGLIWKRPLPRKMGLLGLAASILLLGTCFCYGLVKAYGRARSVDPMRLWAASVEVMKPSSGDYGAATVEEYEELLDRPVGQELEAFEGVWLPGFLLTSGIFRYQADKDAVLDWVSSAPYEPCSLRADSDCEAIPWSTALDKIDWLPPPLLFEMPTTGEEKECYNCFRFPWDHTIIIDKKSGFTYHIVNECRE